MNSEIIKDYKEKVSKNSGEKIYTILDKKYRELSFKFLEQIDSDLNEDGELSKLFKKSIINYYLRRLITSAQFIRRKYSDFGDHRVRNELRSYLKYYTRLEDEEIATILILLINCMQVSEDDFNNSHKNPVKRMLKEYGWGCYICGRDMDFSKNSEEYNAITADHVWPKTLGGESIPENLRYACQECNSKYKKDFIDYSDFHYEEISLVIHDRYNYDNKARDRSYEAAIFAKSNYECVVCEQPAYRVGELYIGRNDLNESWHYLNLSAYCKEHKPE